MPRHLRIRLSDAIGDALKERARTSGQSIHHIVQEALAEALGIEHHSIYQVSTSGAIVRGLYQGCVKVGDLRRHGDLGLGTFDDLDGEMILLDGHCFQARADGSVVEAPDDALTPFAAVVAFTADESRQLGHLASIDALTAELDAMRASENTIAAFRITGTFPELQLRAACRHESGTGLVDATSDQGMFHLVNVRGTMLGFWSPEYSQAINIPGYHLHFVSDDRQHGGHVLAATATHPTVEIHRVSDVHIAMPETSAFLEADLSGDMRADLAIAEGSDRR